MADCCQILDLALISSILDLFFLPIQSTSEAVVQILDLSTSEKVFTLFDKSKIWTRKSLQSKICTKDR